MTRSASRPPGQSPRERTPTPGFAAREERQVARWAGPSTSRCEELSRSRKYLGRMWSHHSRAICSGGRCKTSSRMSGSSVGEIARVHVARAFGVKPKASRQSSGLPLTTSCEPMRHGGGSAGRSRLGLEVHGVGVWIGHTPRPARSSALPVRFHKNCCSGATDFSGKEKGPCLRAF